MEEPTFSRRFGMHRQLSRGIGRLVFSLGALTVAGCDGDDTTAPAVPDVSGVYETVEVAEVANCDPASALDVLDVALGSGTLHGKVRVDQQGEQLTFTQLEIEGQNVEDQHISAVTTIDASGAVRIDLDQSGQFTIFGAGTFFEHVTSSAAGQFDPAAHPMTFGFTGTSTHEYRIGSSTGSLFATCTQSDVTMGTRTSG